MTEQSLIDLLSEESDRMGIDSKEDNKTYRLKKTAFEIRTLSRASTLQPRRVSSCTTSFLPYAAATIRGVRPY